MVDTTARAVIRMKKDKTPTKEAMDELLGKIRCRVRSLEKSEVAKAVEVTTITVDGLA
ncbi:MAG: hypothetical protein H6807_10125 [Planctomycetes bacterium]|nr:hypothetical protein [Planctomycetota bacterium]